MPRFNEFKNKFSPEEMKDPSTLDQFKDAFKKAITGEDNILQPGDEEKFDPTEPRNFLADKINMPEMRISVADRKGYWKNFPEMAGTGMAGTVGKVGNIGSKVIPSSRFGNIMQLGLKAEADELGKVIQKGIPEEGFGKIINASREGAEVVKPTSTPERSFDLAEGLDSIKAYLRSKGASEEQIVEAIKNKFGL